MAKAATRFNSRPPDPSTELERIIAGTPAEEATGPLPVPTPAQDKAIVPVSESGGGISKDDWQKKPTGKLKTTVVKCIVIDRADHWHQNAMIDLKGKDTTAFTWGYYGFDYPILVEKEDGSLKPFYLPDSAGESSNRLYKGANPDGFRATFKHRSSLLQKLQVGLMVALVLGLFGIMFVLINL